MLRNLEDSSELPSPGSTHVRVAVNGDGEASLSIDEAAYPLRVEEAITGFLLIVRTGRFVTAHARTLLVGCDMNEYRRILGCSSI